MKCYSVLLFCFHFSAFFYFPIFLSASSSVTTLPLFLRTSPLFLPPIPPSPSLSVHLYMLLSLYVGTCIAVPLLVLGQLPHSSVLLLLFTHPHLPPTPLLLPVLHVCQGPGGSAQCTAQWPKSEYLRNCQLSPIIRGSP